MNIFIATLLVFASPLKIGDRAPDFQALDTEGNMIRLSQQLQSGPVVLTFYPKAFTSGCSKQMNNYGKLQKKFTNMKAHIIAISADDLETQRKFRKETKSNFPFIADPQGTIIKLYDIKTPLFTFAKRRTFVIGTDGLIKSIESGDDVIDVSSTINIVKSTCGG